MSTTHETTRVITVRLPESEFEAIKELAYRRRLSMNLAIRYAMSEAVKTNLWLLPRQEASA